MTCLTMPEIERRDDVDSPLLTVPEVVERLRVSRSKVYDLMSRGELLSVRVHGCRRVRAEDLDRYVAGLGCDWPLKPCISQVRR